MAVPLTAQLAGLPCCRCHPRGATCLKTCASWGSVGEYIARNEDVPSEKLGSLRCRPINRADLHIL